MTIIGSPTARRVRLDAKHRPTLPAEVLAQAGLESVRELVVRAEGPGRVVLEDPNAVLAQFQARVAAGMAERGAGASLVDGLLADRAADPSAGG